MEAIEGTLKCVYCKQPIYDSHAISGSRVAHYATADQDFGCDSHPDNSGDGVNNHEPNHEELLAKGNY
jgi:hypothetical protein